MNDKRLLAIMYDFYNEHTLRGQNDDINYYINIIKKFNLKNTLVVGAGTGRVAIPISEYTNVDALDIDKERLMLLKEKDKTINTINCNFLEYDNDNNKYDLIIFPYSTIQFFGKYDLFELMINKAYEISNKNTIVIFDVSESFNKKLSINHELLFECYCKKIDDNVRVYYTSIQHEDNIEFIIEYHLVSRNYSVYEHEFYLHYNSEIISKIVNNNNFKIIKIDDGYGKTGFNHKHVYHLKK